MNKIKKIKKKYNTAWSCEILVDLAWSCLNLLILTRSLAWSCLPLILQVLARWSCLILVKNHLARSCKILQDLLIDLAYSSNLQALARSCHLLSLRFARIGLWDRPRVRKVLDERVIDIKESSKPMCMKDVRTNFCNKNKFFLMLNYCFYLVICYYWLNK